MASFSIWYTNGNIETFDLPALSTNYGSGCVMEDSFLHVDDMHEKGIRVSRIYYKHTKPCADGSANQSAEEPVMDPVVIVPPELLDHVYKVCKDFTEIMGQDDHGMLLDPVSYEQFLRMAADDE